MLNNYLISCVRVNPRRGSRFGLVRARRERVFVCVYLSFCYEVCRQVSFPHKDLPSDFGCSLSYHPLRITLDMLRKAEATVKAIKDNELRK